MATTAAKTGRGLALRHVRALSTRTYSWGVVAPPQQQQQQQQQKLRRSWTTRRGPMKGFHSTTVRKDRKRDWYEVLGVPRGASKNEIKKAYFALAKKYHPDTSKEPDAVKRFQEASEAWEVLGNDEKRQAYDQYGHAAEEMGGGYEHVDPFEAFRQAFGQNRGGFQAHGQGIDLEDLLDDFFGGAQRGRSRQQRGPRKGPDVQLGLRLSFMEAAKGVANKEVEWYEITRDGRRGERQKTVMEVPPGVDTGMQIRLQGKGGRGDQNAPRGDLYLQVEVEPDDYFERQGADVHVKVDVDMVQAALGCTVKVLTLDGFVDLTVPPGTQPDAKFRLKNKGLPVVASNRKGAQYVHVHLTVPTSLTPHQRSVLQAFHDDQTKARPTTDDENVCKRTESAWRRLKRFLFNSDADDNSTADNNKKASSG